jgi:hypothetical protein
MPFPPTWAVAAALALCPFSCSRQSATRSDSGVDAPVDRPSAAASPDSSAPTTGPTELGSSSDLAPPPPAGEARRFSVARLEGDALLRGQLGVLRDHFGADAKGPYEVQRVGLAGGRTALLISRADERDPIVLVVDRDQLLWSKLRPTRGILPPVRHLALSPRPDGGVIVFGWVEGLHTVAARMWADDSNPFGDFQLFEPDECDALSAAYAPMHGWVVACSARTGTRVQRMREDGTLAWGRHGVPIGGFSAAPVTIVFDTRSTLMVLQRAAAPGGDRLLAFRSDMSARDLWEAPVDLKMGGRAAGSTERIEAIVVRDGVVRVEPPRHAAGDGRGAVEVDSSGGVRPASKGSAEARIDP